MLASLTGIATNWHVRPHSSILIRLIIPEPNMYYPSSLFSFRRWHPTSFQKASSLVWTSEYKLDWIAFLGLEPMERGKWINDMGPKPHCSVSFDGKHQKRMPWRRSIFPSPHRSQRVLPTRLYWESYFAQPHRPHTRTCLMVASLWVEVETWCTYWSI